MSDVSICNEALQRAGTRSNIAALTEASPEAEACNLIYAATRDELLGMAMWNFSRKTAYLSLLKSAPGTPSNPTASANQWTTDYPSPPWLYEYAYPSDCIRVHKVIQQLQNYYVGVPLTSNGMGIYPFFLGPGAEFQVAYDTDADGNPMQVILTNQYQAIGIYTVRVTVSDIYDQGFKQALVAALAAKLSLALVQNRGKANDLFAMANGLVISARASDGNEGLTIIDNTPDWIAAREDLGGWPAAGYVAPYGPLFGVA